MRALLLLVLFLIAVDVDAQPISSTRITDLTEMRYCGPPKRNARARIIRRADVLAAFRSIHACPATALHRGACPGWAIDHVIPLYCGGCDSVSNLQWLPAPIKSGPGALPKDRWERRIYCIGRLQDG